VGGGWYVRSFIVSGNPVHPADTGIFGYYLWNAADILYQKREQTIYGVPPGTLNVFGALRAAGSLILAPALASLLLPRQPRLIRCLQFVFVAYLLAWFFTIQVPRYLSPVVPIGAVLLFQAIHRVGGRIASAWGLRTPDRKSTRLNSSHRLTSRMPSSA
jgi:hypothetical protein